MVFSALHRRQRRDFDPVLMAAAARDRWAAFIDAWPSLPIEAQPDALARAVTAAPPREYRQFFIDALEAFERRGVRGFDGLDATHLAKFPHRLIVWRGTCDRERDDELGVSWTLSKPFATWFALYGSATTPRAMEEKPMLLRGSVQRDDVRLLTSWELLLHPAKVRIVARHYPKVAKR